MSQDHKRRDLLVFLSVAFGLTILEFLKLPVKKRDAFITGGIAYFAHLFVRLDEELASAIDLILVEEFEEGFVHDIAEEPGEVFFIHADLCGDVGQGYLFAVVFFYVFIYDVDPFVVGGVQLIGETLLTQQMEFGRMRQVPEDPEQHQQLFQRRKRQQLEEFFPERQGDFLIELYPFAGQL